MNIIKALPNQIPELWEDIKFATINTKPYLKGINISKYFVKLAVLLLSSKAQCFVEFDEDRRLNGLLITRLYMSDEGNKVLDLDTLYSFRTTPMEEWIRRFEFINFFASQEKCDLITCSSSVPKLIELVKLVGFEEHPTTFIYRVNGGRQ